MYSFLYFPLFVFKLELLKCVKTLEAYFAKRWSLIFWIEVDKIPETDYNVGSSASLSEL